MAQWKSQDATKFTYRLLQSDSGTSIDLDDHLLRGLIELFVGAQLGFWKQINRLAQTRFPDRRVGQNEIQIVRQFVQDRSNEFVKLFTEHIPHYLMLNCRPCDFEPCTQKKPHYRPNDHYADHLAVWRTPMGHYQLMISETKASEMYPRDLVRKSPTDAKKTKGTMFDEFHEIEVEQHDLSLKTQLLYDLDWTLLISSEEEVERLVELGFWKKDFIYHGCVVTTESNAEESLFDGYEDAAAVNDSSPARRWATIVPISDWQNWVEKIRRIAFDFLAEREEQGHF